MELLKHHAEYCSKYKQKLHYTTVVLFPGRARRGIIHPWQCWEHGANATRILGYEFRLQSVDNWSDPGFSACLVPNLDHSKYLCCKHMT